MVLFKGLKRGNLFVPCGVMTHMQMSCKLQVTYFFIQVNSQINNKRRSET